jgi:hypothetical protein
LLVLALAAASSNAQGSGQTGAKTIDASEMVPGHFIDITEQSGIKFLHQAPHTSRKYLIETMGSGVGLFDCDNDGRLDIFFANGAPFSDPTPKGFIPQKTGPEYWNRLYHQKPDGTFEDITEKAGLKGIGYSMGVAVGDYDNDGNEDLYVTGYGGNRLYHNNGNCTFTDVTWITTACSISLSLVMCNGIGTMFGAASIARGIAAIVIPMYSRPYRCLCITTRAMENSLSPRIGLDWTNRPRRWD